MTRSLNLSLVIIFAVMRLSAADAQTAGSANVPSTKLHVLVSGLHSTRGQVLIWVWNSPDGFPSQDSKRYKFLTLNANDEKSGNLEGEITLPPGTYGVTVLHDENNNGKMDTNFLGIPTEGLGTSNNVVTHFRTPTFQQVSFEVPADGKAIAISMRY